MKAKLNRLGDWLFDELPDWASILIVMAFVIAVILAIVVPIMAWSQVEQNERRDACEAAGGVYESGRNIRLCLNPDALIMPTRLR